MASQFAFKDRFQIDFILDGGKSNTDRNGPFSLVEINLKTYQAMMIFSIVVC